MSLKGVSSGPNSSNGFSSELVKTTVGQSVCNPMRQFPRLPANPGTGARTLQKVHSFFL